MKLFKTICPALKMDNTSLTYDVYTHDTLAVHGNKKLYHTLIKSIGGRWSSRLKIGGPGWIVPRDKQKELDDIIMTHKFSVMEKNAKPRQEQKRYHRSVSGNKHTEELPPPPPPQQPIDTLPPPQQAISGNGEEKTLEELFKKDATIDPRIFNHYKRYSKSPSPSPSPVRTSKKGKKKHHVQSSSSDDDMSSSSDSDFPSSSYSQKKRKKKHLAKEMKKVTEQMKYLEKKFRKLQSKMK